MSDCI